MTPVVVLHSFVSGASAIPGILTPVVVLTPVMLLTAVMLMVEIVVTFFHGAPEIFATLLHHFLMMLHHVLVMLLKGMLTAASTAAMGISVGRETDGSRAHYRHRQASGVFAVCLSHLIILSDLPRICPNN